MATKKKKKKNTNLTKQLSQIDYWMMQYEDDLVLLENADLYTLLSTYKEMLESDETVTAAVDFLVHAVLATILDYTHPDPEIENFVNQNFVGMEGTLHDVFRVALKDGVVFGFHTSEIVYEYRDGKLYLKRFVRLDPTITRFLVDKYGNLQGVRVYSTNQVDIPIGKIFVFSHNSGGSLYGESRLKRAYRAWIFKKYAMRWWAVALEKFGIPPVVGKTTKSNTEELLNVLKNFYSKASLVVSRDDEVDLLESRRNIGDTFEQAIVRADKMIFRSFLLPGLLADEGRVGSYALGRIHLDIFFISVKWLAEELASAFVERVVRPLLEYNGYTNLNNWGRFTILNEPSAEEKWRLAQAFFQLTSIGILNPEKDSKWMRDMLRFPNPDEKEGV